VPFTAPDLADLARALSPVQRLTVPAALVQRSKSRVCPKTLECVENVLYVLELARMAVYYYFAWCTPGTSYIQNIQQRKKVSCASCARRVQAQTPSKEKGSGPTRVNWGLLAAAVYVYHPSPEKQRLQYDTGDKI
jgi:hypothetical protein